MKFFIICFITPYSISFLLRKSIKISFSYFGGKYIQLFLLAKEKKENL
jgi:hypothetical protein